MNNLNSTILEGNAVRKPELKKTVNGKDLCIFSIAVGRSYKNSKGGYDNEVSYFDVETYGKLAEFCANATEKGRGIRVVGRLKQHRWKNTDGKSSSKIYVVAEHVEFKPLKKNNSAENKSISKDADLAEDQIPEEQLMEAHQAMVEEAIF